MWGGGGVRGVILFSPPIYSIPHLLGEATETEPDGVA